MGKRKTKTAICPKCGRRYIVNPGLGYVYLVSWNPCYSLRRDDGTIYYQSEQCTIAELRGRVAQLERASA